MQRLFKPMKTLVLFRTLDSSESNGNSRSAFIEHAVRVKELAVLRVVFLVVLPTIKYIFPFIISQMVKLHVYAIMYTVRSFLYTAISIKVVHEQSGKVEYEREWLLGIATK
jgi:hypothetical protein